MKKIFALLTLLLIGIMLVPVSPVSADNGNGPNVWFNEQDTALCSKDSRSITVILYGSVPGNESATLQGAWHIVKPNSTETIYTSVEISGDGLLEITGEWPGINPEDTVVEVHFGGAILRPNGNPYDTASLDFYWHPWVCEANPVATSTFIPQNTPTPEETLTPVETEVPTELPSLTNTPENVSTSTPTSISNIESENTETATTQPTNTSVVISTNTAVSTVEVQVVETDVPEIECPLTIITATPSGSGNVYALLAAESVAVPECVCEYPWFVLAGWVVAGAAILSALGIYLWKK